MRGHQVPSDPLFSATTRTPGSADRRTIDAPQFIVNLAGLDLQCSKASQNFVQGTIVVPFVEQVPYRGPGTKFLRQIAPRRSGPHDPKNTIDDRATITRWSPGPRGRWKNIRNGIPLLIRKSMSRHSFPPWVRTRHQFALIPKTTKYQFSDKA
jgi:hypothetical protein